MTPRLLTPLLPLAALALATAACQPAEDDEPKASDRPTSYALVPEDATLAWSAQLAEDWSPTHAVSVGDVVVVSTGWEIDEGSEVIGYGADGSVLWQDDNYYGGVLLAPVGDDQVIACDDEEAQILSVADGSVVGEAPADDERCPVADDEAGIPVPRNDEAYTLGNGVLTVAGPDGEYDVALDPGVTEIWGVDGGVVGFVDETDTVVLYR